MSVVVPLQKIDIPTSIPNDELFGTNIVMNNALTLIPKQQTTDSVG